MSEERIIFGANLREARRAKKLSQRDVTAQTGFAQAYISDIETGKSSINIDNMAALARLVGVPLWKLLQPPSTPRNSRRKTNGSPP
jgi:transcriptional regulator with XRE-family HTH domain